YLHSRLLERCAKLNDELGGGSLTGLPVIETKANDISAYIPTNVISITDGQCFFQSDLFNSGQRPAVDVTTSVSRVGGDAQIKAMKTVSGSLRIDLSQYEELKSFAAFASDLDATSRAQLDRGARLYELLRQPQYSPVPVEQQVVTVYLGTNGAYDEVPVEDVARFNREFQESLRHRNEGILAEIRDTGKWSEDLAERVVNAVNEFKKGFTTSEGKPLKEAEAEAMAADEVGQETVKVNRPAPSTS
ncbi:MAG: F0F1 ATP synthase subunit alpha, partial [Actinophytocola sp.]